MAVVTATLAACAQNNLHDPVPAASAKPGAPSGLPADSPDLLAVLVSNFTFGPNMEDADVTARYYCSLRGKQPVFVRRDVPPELRAPTLLNGVKPSFAVMIYRCITTRAKTGK